MFLAILLSTLLGQSAPQAGKPGVEKISLACPRSEVTFRFETAESALSTSELEMLDALVNRTRQCKVIAVILYTEMPVTELTEQRAAVLREALIARGVSETLLTHDLTPGFSLYAIPRPEAGVTVLLDMR